MLDRILHRVGFKRILLHLNTDKTDGGIFCSKKLPFPRQRDTDPIAGLKLHGFPVDNNLPLPLKNSIDFFIVFVRMDKNPAAI